jgi:dienelactone hydrolase
MNFLTGFIVALLSAAPAGVEVGSFEVADVETTGGRVPIRDDAVLRAALAGENLPGEWRPAEVEGGVLRARASHGRLTLRSDADRVVMFRAKFHAMLVANGRPRPGDVYGYGFWSLPMKLDAGENKLVLRLSRRGAFEFEITEPKARAFFADGDQTLFDPRQGEPARLPVGLVVVSAGETPLRATVEVDGKRQATVTIAALTRQKVPAIIDFDGGETCTATVRLLDGEEVLDEVALQLPVLAKHEPYRRTFVSGVDGSVQHYAVRPALRPEVEAVVLSLHGASVEAMSQARAYTAKPTWPIVCPTNRRPFGFDWEDWGRIDALEALADARRHLGAGDAPTYLTGHSMGGHGTWHLGLTSPDTFAALAPSAGWASFDTYPNFPGTLARHPAGFRQASRPSDTLALIPNLRGRGVYLLHGEADDNVPVGEAQLLHEAAKLVTQDVVFDVRPGQGHWWDDPATPGADCVNLPEIFEFFQGRTAAAGEAFTLVTVNPAVTATRGHITINQQIEPLELSRVEVDGDEIKTENVRHLTIRDRAGRPVIIDGEPVTDAAPDVLHLMHGDAGWAVAAEVPAAEKNPIRHGPFEHVFANRVTLVVGTQGDADQTAAARALARFHAESFAYRGNGTLRIVDDADLNGNGQNLVLYGNAKTNAAWHLLGEADRNLPPNAGLLMVRPHADHPAALIGAVAADSPAALRQLALVPIFTTGVTIPDWAIFDVAGGQVLDAGIFGNDWE